MFPAPVIYRTNAPESSLASYELLPNTYVVGATSPSLIARRSVLGLHGTGSWNGKLVSDLADASALVDSRDVYSWETIGERLRGSVTLYAWDRISQELAVLPDPLGAGIVYRYTSATVTAVSSHLPSLAQFLEARGVKLTRSAKYSASLIITGSGGMYPSSYVEIDALEHFEYVVFGHDSVQVRTYGVKQRVFSNSHSYEDGLLETYQEVLECTKAAIESKHDYKIAHLTGGFDSRVVLGALLKLGGQEEFKYYCLPSVKADREVAEGLAGSYGLEMTNYSGADWAVLPGSVDEQFLGPMVRSGGILPTAPDIGMSNAGSLILQGGYGEFYRTFFSTDMSGAVLSNPRELAEKMWGIRGYPALNGESIFKHDFAEEIALKLKVMVDEGVEMGIRADAIPDYLYMRVRNRYFVGTQSREWSSIGSQFDTLYGLSSLSATYRLDFDTRRSNVFGFDLLQMFDKDLIRYPYAKTTPFNWKYQRLRGLPETLEFDAATVPRFDSRQGRVGVRRNGTNIAGPTQRQIDLANRMNLPSTRIAQMELAAPLLLPMIDQIRDLAPEFSDVFNMELLTSKLSGQVESPADVNLILTMYSSCLWLAERDKAIWN